MQTKAQTALTETEYERQLPGCRLIAHRKLCSILVPGLHQRNEAV